MRATHLRLAQCASFAAVALLSLSALGQDRDFLTADEIDRVRETAEDPNRRLALYSELARLRVDMIKQAIAKEKAGRSGFVHSTLEDYTRIIEAIDTVTDDALKRGKSIAEGLAVVAKAEEAMLTDLKKIEASAPPDLARYEFTLTTAIETTQDSLELAREDLAERKAAVAARESAEREQRQTLMTPEAAKERAAAEAKQKAEETKQKRKMPTLRRPGDAPPKNAPR